MPPSPDDADFAARLRALKEGSGRSYAALARRAHVSSSALHRYCHGQVTPTDPAVVDEIAAACRASQAQAAELRAAWRAAVAGAVRVDESEPDQASGPPRTTEPAQRPPTGGVDARSAISLAGALALGIGVGAAALAVARRVQDGWSSPRDG